MKNKFKSPIFWIGLVSTVLLAAGVEPDTLTSWVSVLEAFEGILMNPVALVACILAAYSIFNDNGVKGFDKLK